MHVHMCACACLHLCFVYMYMCAHVLCECVSAHNYLSVCVTVHKYMSEYSYIIAIAICMYTCIFKSHSTPYYEVSHILCPTLNNPMDNVADSFNVTMAISTFSMTPVQVFIEAIAIEREEFILEYAMCNLLHTYCYSCIVNY